jgi:hypothetical protein
MKGHWIKKPENNTVVIFVHGILSNADDCWKNDNGTYWPVLLSKEEDIKETGIYTFSYSTGIFSGTYSLGDIVDAFKEQLKMDGVLKQDRHLIFVCHSMGGLVVRKYIVDRIVDLISFEIKIGLFLVASPSLGSNYANLLTGFGKILNIENLQAEVLRFSNNNQWLNDLDKNFINIKESENIEIFGKELIEDKPIVLKRLLKNQVVAPFSGARYFGEPFKIPNSDHFSISKPSSANDTQHKVLSNFVKEFIDLSGRKTGKQNNDSHDLISSYLKKKLDQSLSSFSSQPLVWVEPIISKSSELSKDSEKPEMVDILDVVKNPRSIIVKALPEFGLTCLAHFIIKTAWQYNSSSLWLYLDANNLKPHNSFIEKTSIDELKNIGKTLGDVRCVVLDSWKSHNDDSIKLLKKVSEFFNEIPLIVMQTTDQSKVLNQEIGEFIDRNFEVLYLWALSRGHVRKIVSEYNSFKEIGVEDIVINKLISDLDVLNIHRTPLNCLTLLKIFENGFDDSPVNRADMISKVLFLLFNVDNIPSYKPRPDMKDCEFVLGRFCEKLFKENNYIFSRINFISEIEKYCREEFIDLEVQVVFDVLYENNIIINCLNMFRFRFSYWIYYFLAQRMFHSSEFSSFILDDMRYTKFPEVIEFYTGIDRKRNDAIEVLIRDIKNACEKVQERCGLPDGLNPYQFAKWEPSNETLEKMNNEIRNGVQESNLPESIKDSYADNNYDHTKPYNQEVREILSEHTFVIMMQAMKAGSKALRNSDYVTRELKCFLLLEIMSSWEKFAKVLMVLIPPLAVEGAASFEGQNFFLCGTFGDDPLERMQRILLAIPHNIAFLTQDDLYSKKMGPLLINQFLNEENILRKHILLLILINNRPNDWKIQVESYVASIDKNSFYLLDIYRALRIQYRYSYASTSDLRNLEYLIKLSAAKHTKLGHKMPSKKHINKIVPESVIPPRDSDLNI